MLYNSGIIVLVISNEFCTTCLAYLKSLALQTFFACQFCFLNTDHVTTLRRVFSFKVGDFEARTQSFQ